MHSSKSKTYKLGNDLTVNRMGFGAMRITGKGVWGQPENRGEAIRVLQALPGLGVNFIDTADSYGPHVSEELITEALYPYPRDLVSLPPKVVLSDRAQVCGARTVILTI